MAVRTDSDVAVEKTSSNTVELSSAPVKTAEVKTPEVKTAEAVQPEIAVKAGEKPFYNVIKRVFDIFCSVVGFIAASPLFLLFSVLIKLERTGEKVIYKQKRLGQHGKTIYIYKFRSMVDDADNLERWLNKDQIKQYRTEYKVENDPRTTKFGSFLRRTGLDEMPQLINILKGELSLVGPRPIQEEELEFYGKDKDLLLSVKPGLTGYWQAYCSEDVTYTNKKRQQMELHYVKNCNMLWDLKICFATAGAILRKAKRGQ